MFRPVMTSALMGLAVLSVVAKPAEATLVLPDPSYTLTFDNYGTGQFTYLHTASGALDGSSAAINTGSGPTVSATSSGQSFASAQLTYYLAINAPNTVTSVPIDIAYAYHLVGITDQPDNPSGNPSGASLRYFYTGAPATIVFSVNSNNQNPVINGYQNTVDVSGVYSGTAAVNTKITVTMNVGANGAGGSAYMDPTFSIDPSFFSSNPQYSQSDFTISESNGVANGPAVDVTEPGSLVVVGAALTGLGLLRRRASAV